MKIMLGLAGWLMLVWASARSGIALADSLPPSALAPSAPAIVYPQPLRTDALTDSTNAKLVAFAHEYDQVTDFQIAGFLVSTGGSTVSLLLASKHPATAVTVAVASDVVGLLCLVSSWIHARRAACEFCKTCGECADVLGTGGGSESPVRSPEEME